MTPPKKVEGEKHEPPANKGQGGVFINNAWRHPSPLQLLAMLSAIWVCCAISILYFYGLVGAPPPFPLRNYTEEILAVARTSLAATLVALCVVWVGSARRDSRGGALLRAACYSQVALTAYGLAGLGLPTKWLTPSTFFAEYNWLTFILEVAPATSIALVAILYFSGRRSPKSL